MSFSIINFDLNRINVNQNNNNRIVNLLNNSQTDQSNNSINNSQPQQQQQQPEQPDQLNNNLGRLDEISNVYQSELELIRLSKSMPSERMGHVCVAIRDRFLLVWGGHRYDDSRNEIYLNPTLIWIFDIELESWLVLI